MKTRVTCAVAMLLMLGCGSGIMTGRVGKPIALPTGQPTNACERRDWYELAPAQVEVSGQVHQGTVIAHYRAAARGMGVFKLGEDEPVDADDILDPMQEPELAAAHRARIQPVDDALWKSFNWALGGLVGMAGGIGGAAAVQGESPAAAAVLGVGGLVFGVVAVVVSLGSQPSGYDQMEADARRQLFFADEDDVLAVQRGVYHLNSVRRQRCGGPPPQPWVPTGRDLVPPPANPPTPSPSLDPGTARTLVPLPVSAPNAS